MSTDDGGGNGLGIVANPKELLNPTRIGSLDKINPDIVGNISKFL